MWQKNKIKYDYFKRPKGNGERENERVSWRAESPAAAGYSYKKKKKRDLAQNFIVSLRENT